MSEIILEARDLEAAFRRRAGRSRRKLTVRANERIAIIGPNGAGKTTFINLCTAI